MTTVVLEEHALCVQIFALVDAGSIPRNGHGYKVRQHVRQMFDAGQIATRLVAYNG